MYAGTGYGSFIGRSVDAYQLMVSAKENQIEKSLEVVLTENERVRQFGFLASELEREKKDMLSMMEKMAKEADKTESASYADEYIRNFLEKEPIPGIQKEFEITREFLPGITLDEINQSWKRVDHDDNIVVPDHCAGEGRDKVPTESAGS